MRTAFVETLLELAEADPRVMLLTADLGWSVLEPFAARFPHRFLNVGVAEQNLAGVATGLARAGRIPFIYSIATFLSMRCYEQLRDGPFLHRLPVRIVGSGGGFAYGHAGPTHHAVEDLCLFRVQPGLTVVAPADSAQARAALRQTQALEGPVYLRIDRAEAADLPELGGRFSLETPELIRPGRHVLLLATGTIAHEAVRAAQLLEWKGVAAAVAVMAHLPPEPVSPLTRLLAQYRHVMTVEEGLVAGGLGSLVCETVAQSGLACRVRVCGVRGPLGSGTGTTSHLRSRAGLDAESLVEVAFTLLHRRKPWPARA